MTLVQLRVAMAGLDPWAFSPRTRSVGIHVLATGTGDANNRVDARVKPAHDDLQLVSDQDTTTHSRSPDSPARKQESKALGFNGCPGPPLARGWRAAAAANETEAMYRYIIKRLLLVIPTLLGAAALVFLLMRLIPGDICVVRLGSGGGTFDERAVQVCHAQLGLDRPMFLQFVDFVWGFFRGDFGISMWSGKPVLTEIAARFPVSLEIAIMAVVVANVIAIPLGTISALKQNSPIDLVIRVFSIAGLATPSFWLGILFILAILNVSQAAFGAPWMPPIEYVPIWQDPLRNLSMVIFPALTVGYRTSAVTMRMTRSAMLEVLREDYIRTARAKGLVERIIINRHALKNALLPVVTLIGIEAAFLIGGLVVTEQVFNLNGIGRLLVQSIQNQDYTMTQALVMLVVAVFVLTNTVVDLLYAWLDPRIRYG
jgi:peptide/nickel transport system permease protein